MYSIDFRNIYIPKRWESAHRNFNETPQPRRGGNWEDNERPLRDRRAHHLRIVRNDDESYDLMLYRHTMLRYHKPTTTHCTVDVFVPWAGISNWAYLRQAGFGWGSTLHALRHDHPVWLHPYPSSEPESQSAHLVFKLMPNGAHYLDTTKSWQLQAYRYKYVDPERKTKDAFMRDRVKALVLLLAIAQNNYKPEYNQDYRMPIRWYGDAPAAQFKGDALRVLNNYACGLTNELTPAAATGMTKWFERTLDVRCTAQKDEPMTDAQIENALVGVIKRKQPSEARIKVPVKMWRSGGNRPSRNQFFHTRAEAEKAKAAALDPQ
jgi:hypothetical protein